jgi:hypothetical protein
MSDPLVERLSRFTPNASGLDRDSLLFQAGRASVRPAHTWKAVAAALALCQLLTLAMLGPRPGPAPTPTARSVRPSAASPPRLAQAPSVRELNDHPDSSRLLPSDDLVPDEAALPAVSALATASFD